MGTFAANYRCVEFRTCGHLSHIPACMGTAVGCFPVDLISARVTQEYTSELAFHVPGVLRSRSPDANVYF